MPRLHEAMNNFPIVCVGGPIDPMSIALREGATINQNIFPIPPMVPKEISDLSDYGTADSVCVRDVTFVIRPIGALI
jgi:hypothetical protein